jgi:hypothetical protein
MIDSFCGRVNPPLETPGCGVRWGVLANRSERRPIRFSGETYPFQRGRKRRTLRHESP